MNRTPRPTIDQQIEEKLCNQTSCPHCGKRISEDVPTEFLLTWLRSDAIPLPFQDGCNKVANRIDRLAADLLKHGGHTKSCPASWNSGGLKCTCGWDALKAKLKQGKGE